jgi:hypothetical protein
VGGASDGSAAVQAASIPRAVPGALSLRSPPVSREAAGSNVGKHRKDQ